MTPGVDVVASGMVACESMTGVSARFSRLMVAPDTLILAPNVALILPHSSVALFFPTNDINTS